MSRNLIALIWLAGTVLAILLYVAGPGHFIGLTLAAVDRAEWVVANAIGFLSMQTFDLVRAAAIALFAVFLALGGLASQRGVGRGSGLVGVSVLFVVLIAIGGYDSRFCWFAALLVAGAGAVSMTQRLLWGPPRSPWQAGVERRSRI
ncbi:MAG TPA: hypothetical protein VIZ17_09210 [Acetobacteraceae bacterium]